MLETDFIILWKEQYDQLNQSFQINQRILKEMLSKKASGAIEKLKVFKVFGVIITLFYLGLLGMLLLFAIRHYSPAVNFFIVSMATIFFINLRGLIDYIQHLIWIARIDYDDAITVIQEKLLQLQFSLFRHNRIMFLQIPFWTTFYLSSEWFPKSVGIGFIIFQCLFTGSFCLLTVWLYRNCTIKNADKRWVKIFIKGTGGKSVQAALSFYAEMEQFKLDR